MTCPTADDLEPTERGREDRPEGFSMSRRTEEEKDIEDGKRGRGRERRRGGEGGEEGKEKVEKYDSIISQERRRGRRKGGLKH